MVDNAIKPAIRTALRFHEIGNETPYRISFAGKGKSGGSFGFMQGDLAAGQPAVISTFRDAMSAAGMSAQKINELVALLSQHQIKNPLTPADKDAVDQALQASRALVDAMDEQILQDVYGDLDRCDARAAAHQRSIEAKAFVYMALWINMSGPPTKLLTWLDGGDPHLAHKISPAGQVVSGDDMEDYLAATNYYVENPQNLKHLHDCAAKGMQALNGAAPVIAMTVAADIAAPLLPQAAPTDMVKVAAKSPTGEDYVVTIRKTGSDTGAIEFGKANAEPKHFDISGIKARADGTKLTCSAMFVTVTCALRAGQPPTSDSIEITIGGIFGSTTIYTLSHPDFDSLKGFISHAGFPAIPPSGAPMVAFAAVSPGVLAQGALDAAAGSFAERAVQNAIDAWDKFGRQTYNVEGQVTHHGHLEDQDPWYKYVGEYWSVGLNDDTRNGKDGVAWSAAFISWLMRTAGASDRFVYSERHAVYVSRAIRDLEKQRLDAGYWCYRLHDAKPAPGDIVCWGRQAGVDYDHQHGGDYKGHCDLVISVGPTQIEIIGGNVGNSVTRRPLALDDNGFIKPVIQHGENLFGLMKCRL